MTPEQEAEFNDMKERLAKTEAFVKAMTESNNIPLEVDQSLSNRGFIKASDVIYFNAGDSVYTSADINLSGDPETINVMGKSDAWGYFVDGPFAGYIFPLYLKPRTF